MHTYSASLLTNAMLITVCVLAVGFLLWFLRALTLEKNSMRIHCRMEFKIDDPSIKKMERQPLREVSARSLRPNVDLVQPDFASQMLVTHRAVRVVQSSPKPRPYFVQ